MFIKVRVEEVLIGASLGASLGLAASAPLSVGMPSLIPGLSAGPLGLMQSALAAALVVVGAGLGGWLAGHQERDSHVRGAIYFGDFAKAKGAMQAQEDAQFSEAQQKAQVHGVTIGGVELARSREVGHIYAVGLPGSGKTVLLTSVIDQALARGDRVVLHDPKGDFIERYYDPANTVLLGPWDERAAIWDATADIDSPALADEFGVAVVGRGSGDNKYFDEGAAVVLAGLIRAEQRDRTAWSWRDLADALSSDPCALVSRAAEGNARIKTTMPSAMRGDDIDKGELTVLSVLSTASAWLTNYAAVDAADPDRPRFSLRRWLTHQAHEETQIVILNSHTVYPMAGESIFGSILSTIAATASSPVLPEISADAGGGLWMILDEFPQLGPVALAKIQQIAELGRSRGFRMVTGLQDETQLRAKVGREKADPMLSMQSTRIYMGSSDLTAEAVSRRIGQREILRIDSTAEGGATGGKTKRADHQTVIQPSDLMGLHVRKKKPPYGVELVMHIGGTLGRLVQPFPSRHSAKAPRFLESETWRAGAVPTRDPMGSEPELERAAELDGEAAAPRETDRGTLDPDNFFSI